ncbi:enoyl-CoA hydratase/isomerase family protein [Isoalcanivorax beigongshangi]|uniref:Enoyl-CoA hydratase/isomerase family protein n=1 Tax=Isoalcanivorax beigongshangi TaxID=3238810 RepID=A0ABV4ADN6_9GAMM
MSEPLISQQRDGAVAIIRFNRPDKLNALTLSMYDALGAAFAAAQADPEVRVMVLTGTGERAFCVGADLTESIPELASGRIDISAWDGAHMKGAGITKPVIAAVNGLCLGGGFEIMLATDLRIAAESAEFALPEPGIGVVPAGGTLVRLVRQVAYAHAMELMLTAERFDAASLLRMGVLNQVVPAEQVLPEALALAHRIAALSPVAIQLIKRATRELYDLPWPQAFAAEASLGQQAFTSADAQRGLSAFAERRKADF